MGRDPFIHALLQSVAGMSRTAQTGSVNALGRAKPESKFSPDRLQEASKRGIALAGERLWEYRNRLLGVRDLQLLELQMFASINGGVRTSAMYRMHETGAPYGVPPDQIRQEMNAWFREFQQRLERLTASQVSELCAWVEWELDFRIHPYADGCGRLCKLWSALVCLRAYSPLTIYQDRTTYYARMNEGYEAFREYYLYTLRGVS